MATYSVGDAPVLTAQFKNAAGVPTDSASVVCTVRDPSGAVTTPTVQHPSTGTYTASVDLTNAKPGEWWYRFQGVSPLQAAAEQSFTVVASNV